MPHLDDRRGQLYVPRLAWLDEHSLQGALRALYIAGWAAMDDLFVSGLADQIREAGK